MAREGVALGEVFPAAGVQHIATVHCQCELFVEEILAHTEVETIGRLAITLRDGLPRTEVAGELHGDVVRQLERPGLSGVPCEGVPLVACNNLAFYREGEAIEPIVISIHIGGEVEYAEEPVLQCEFCSGALALGHIHRGGVHDSILRALP